MNITGTFNQDLTLVTGAFYDTGSTTTSGPNAGGSVDNILGFDASRSWTGETSSNGSHSHTFSGTTGNASSSIYGQSSYVQPKSVATTPILKY